MPLSIEQCCPIVELRRYVLHRGQRDVLIELFDRELVETQEAAGMRVIGQFRDLDDPDAFVWLRGFADMPGRAVALKAFYGGPAWKRHAAAANATMIDSDDVRLMRPAGSLSGFELDSRVRPAIGAADGNTCLVVASILPFAAAVDPDVIERLENSIRPAVTQTGGVVLASFVTEDSPNTFPALPIRGGEHLFVWFTRFDGAQSVQFRGALAPGRAWLSNVLGGLADRLVGPPLLWRLTPTTRSLVR